MKKFLAFSSLSLALQAGSIGVPVSFDSAQVLPKGVRNLRYNYLMGEANDKFNSSGAVVGVGQAMNVDVTYQKLIDGDQTPIGRGILEGYLSRHGKNKETVVGKTTGVVNVEVDAQIPVLAWGITRKWTAALVVPVVTVRTHVDTGFVAYAPLQAMTEQLMDEGKDFKAREVKEKTDSAIVNKNDRYGYKPLSSSPSYQEKTELGDIRLVNKVQVSKKTDYTLALVQELVLPTGREADLDRSVDVPIGDGQFDVGLGAIAEYNLSGRSRLWTRLSYIWQSPDQVAKRVPESADSSLSPDIDGQVSRDLGDGLYLSAGGSLMANQDIKFQAQYSFQYKERDEYRGDRYEAHRYKFLGLNSEQSLHALQLGVNFSTISRYRKKQFPVPLDFNLVWATPIAGKNVTRDSSVVAEAAIFF